MNNFPRTQFNIKKFKIGGLSTIGVNRTDLITNQTENSTIKQFKPPPESDITYHKINERFKQQYTDNFVK